MLLAAAAVMVVVQTLWFAFVASRIGQGFGLASTFTAAQTGNQDLIGDVRTSVLVALFLAAVLAVSGYAVVATCVFRGKSWPRGVGIALAVISLPALFFGPAADAAVVFGIVAVVLLWLPASRAYCDELRYAAYWNAPMPMR